MCPTTPRNSRPRVDTAHSLVYNTPMNDITFDTFRSEVLNCTSYDFTDEMLLGFYEDGYTVHDTLDWAEAKLDDDMFGDAW